MTRVEFSANNESEANLPPRKILENMLVGKEAGSIESLAIADWSEKIKLTAVIEMRGETTLLAAQAAAVEETIRRMKFGKDGTRYCEAFYQAYNLKEPYEQQVKKDSLDFWKNRGEEAPDNDKNFYTYQGMNLIQDDLLRINRNEGSRGK